MVSMMEHATNINIVMIMQRCLSFEAEAVSRTRSTAKS